jgi:hypothetical protein
MSAASAAFGQLFDAIIVSGPVDLNRRTLTKPFEEYQIAYYMLSTGMVFIVIVIVCSPFIKYILLDTDIEADGTAKNSTKW